MKLYEIFLISSPFLVNCQNHILFMFVHHLKNVIVVYPFKSDKIEVTHSESIQWVHHPNHYNELSPVYSLYRLIRHKHLESPTGCNIWSSSSRHQYPWEGKRFTNCNTVRYDHRLCKRPVEYAPCWTAVRFYALSMVASAFHWTSVGELFHASRSIIWMAWKV